MKLSSCMILTYYNTTKIHDFGNQVFRRKAFRLFDVILCVTDISVFFVRLLLVLVKLKVQTTGSLSYGKMRHFR